MRSGPELETEPVPARTLWRHRDFLLLWSGQTVSEMGSAVTQLALPLTAVVVLRASTFQVGLQEQGLQEQGLEDQRAPGRGVPGHGGRELPGGAGPQLGD